MLGAQGLVTIPSRRERDEQLSRWGQVELLRLRHGIRHGQAFAFLLYFSEHLNFFSQLKAPYHFFSSKFINNIASLLVHGSLLSAAATTPMNLSIPTWLPILYPLRWSKQVRPKVTFSFCPASLSLSPLRQKAVPSTLGGPLVVIHTCGSDPWFPFVLAFHWWAGGS